MPHVAAAIGSWLYLDIVSLAPAGQLLRQHCSRTLLPAQLNRREKAGEIETLTTAFYRAGGKYIPTALGQSAHGYETSQRQEADPRCHDVKDADSDLGA